MFCEYKINEKHIRIPKNVQKKEAEYIILPLLHNLYNSN